MLLTCLFFIFLAMNKSVDEVVAVVRIGSNAGVCRRTNPSHTAFLLGLWCRCTNRTTSEKDKTLFRNVEMHNGLVLLWLSFVFMVWPLYIRRLSSKVDAISFRWVGKKLLSLKTSLLLRHVHGSWSEFVGSCCVLGYRALLVSSVSILSGLANHHTVGMDF